jgi:hypothetical protein
MADNVAITAGSGTSIATDDVSSVHFQKVKLDGGGDGATAPITGDTANGLDVDVTRLPALVAGTANIGDVDVLTVPAPLSTTGGGTEATALRVTIATDSTGLVSVDDNGASLSIDDGGNTITVDGTVAVSGTVTVAGAVTNAGTFLVQDNQVATDNVGFTDGTTKVFSAGFIFDEVAGTALTENDAAAARVDSKRAQVLVIEDATTRGQRAAVSAAGAQVVAGDVAHDTADSTNNPVKVGFQARSTLPTAVTSADRVNGTADLFGRQLVSHIDPAMFVSKSFNATTTQTGTDVWDPTGGTRIAVTSVVIGTSGTTAGRVILWFGDNADTTYTAGTDQLLLAFSTAPSATVKPGLVFTPATPVFCTTADRELHITTDAAVSIDIAVHGYEY